MTAKEEYQFIAILISNSLKELSQQMAGEATAIRFRFIEEFNRDAELLTITLYSSTPGNGEIPIQEFRYKINKEHNKHIQFVYAYKGFLNYLLTTSLLTLHNLSLQIKTDEELQTASKAV